MQWATLCILLLAISEPLLCYAKKVVVMVPRQIKRSPAIAWRPGPMYYKKSPYGGDFRNYGYQSRPAPYYGKRPYHPPPAYSYGGEDYDQGYESMNHPHMAYSKDIGHGMHYGKGYNPYESMKVAYTYGHESRYPRYKPKYMEPDYPPTSYSSTGPDYPTGQSYDGSNMDAMFPDVESALDYRERRNDRKKYYTSRSIEKELGLKAQFNLNSLLEKEKEQQQQQQQLQQQQQQLELQLQQLQQQQLQQQQQQQHQQQQQQSNANVASDLYKEALSQGHDMQGSITLPSGIPSPTIGGNKDGIVLRDTVSLDDYHRKLEEITKSWPDFLNSDGTENGASFQQQVHGDYPTAGLQSSSFTGSPSWFSDYAQEKQGYAVKEELSEPTHDFRNMPLQTASFQNLPLSVNMGVPGLPQTVHG